MAEAYTVRSTEHRDYKVKHHCTHLATVAGTPGRERILVEIDPPIPGWVYDQASDLELLVLGPRFAGSALLPNISEWPMYVYMMVPEKGGTWDTGPFLVLDWGELERE